MISKMSLRWHILSVWLSLFLKLSLHFSPFSSRISSSFLYDFCLITELGLLTHYFLSSLTQTSQSVSFLTDKSYCISFKIIILSSFSSNSQMPVSLVLVTGKVLSSFGGGTKFLAFPVSSSFALMFAHLRGQSSLFCLFRRLWKRRIFTWKCLWDSGWMEFSSLMLGKHSGIVSRQLHQQLRSAWQRRVGSSVAQTTEVSASGSGIYSCWGPQWQRLLGVFFCSGRNF